MPYINFPASRMCTTKWVQEGVSAYLLDNGCNVTLDMHSVTSKKFREHGLYRLTRNKATQKYTAYVCNTLQQKHQVKFYFGTKVNKDGNLPESPEGY